MIDNNNFISFSQPCCEKFRRIEFQTFVPSAAGRGAERQRLPGQRLGRSLWHGKILPLLKHLADREDKG
jgi:hypothetical protein